jgi:DHA2 family multidrug resistance protein-like MFS transporter
MTNLKAGKREWIALAVLTLPCMLYTIDLAVLYLAVPRLSAELKPSSSALLWIVDIRGFMIAGLLITMGTLGDRIGRRRLLFEVIPEFRNPGASRLDIVSVLTSIGAALAVIYGLKRIAEIGLAWLPAAFILVGFAIGFVFVRRQRGLADPLIDIRLFRIPAFSTALAVNTFSVFVTLGSLFFVAQYLQLVLGLSPLQAGLWTIPQSIGFMVGFMVTPMIARHVRAVYIMAGGLALAAISGGLLAFGLFGYGAYGLAIVVIATTLMSLGLSSAEVVGTDIIVAVAPLERSGAASAISGTGAEFGGALGITVLGSIGAMVYRAQMTDAIPADIPPLAAEAARGTLGGAISMAKQFPGLLEPVHHAFVQSMYISISAATLIALTMAIVVIASLRRIPDAMLKQKPNAVAEESP